MKKKSRKWIIALETVILVFSVIFMPLSAGNALEAIGGERMISLDLKGMDIVEVLKTLASKGRMNLVVGSNVRGRVTMFLKDVDIADAFELILAANNLAIDRRGDIIYVMTQRDYEQLYGERYGDKKEARIIQLRYAKAAEVNKVLSQIKTKIGKVIVDEGSNTIVIIDAPHIVLRAIEIVRSLDKPTTTRIFELSYAKAADIKEKIQESLTKGVGTIQVDERTNKVVITDLEEKIGEIEEVIAALDSRLRQVLLDAKILEVTLTDEYKLGVDWQAIFKVLQEEMNLRSAFNLTASGGLVPGAEILVGSFNNSDFTLMVQALREMGDVNTLSNPRIMVMNNEEAKILVGENLPYATSAVTQGTATATVSTSLTFVDTGVKLYVTPTINREGFITVKIRPEVSTKSGDYDYYTSQNPTTATVPTTVPIISTTQAETNVMVKDGMTIIIGGLIKDERSSSKDKVPILGDLPLIGLGFGKREDKVTKKELVIFLTPHIISGENNYTEVEPSPPINEKKFTESEKPAFRRRKPEKVDPTFFSKKYLKKRPVKSKREMDLSSSAPEAYFYTVKNAIMESLVIPEGATWGIKEGDKVKVSFCIYSGGNLALRPEIIESTNDYFSRLVLLAVEDAAPFPVFPSSIKEHKKDFVLDIIYNPRFKEEGNGL